MASTIFDRESAVLGRYLLVLCLALLGTGCASKQVVVEGNFPTPLLDPLPVTLGVIYPPAFAQHEFFDEAKGRAESDWLVKTGEAQVEFWDILFSGNLTSKAGIHIKNNIIEKIIKDICQVEKLLKIFAIIGNINIPKPPQAVTYPAALLLFSFVKCLETIGVSIVPAAPAKPKPTNKPKLICSHIPEI